MEHPSKITLCLSVQARGKINFVWKQQDALRHLRTSPYALGLVLIRKKERGLRVCVDYRGINKDTIPDHYPIPCIDDLIDTVGRQQGKLFTLDLMKGYHQIRMHFGLSPASVDLHKREWNT